MAGRILLAGLTGGIALFLWGALSHNILELGNVGIKELPQERPLLEMMRATIRQPGLYFYPGTGLPPHATPQQRNEALTLYEQRYMQGPYGVLIYHPTGTKILSFGQVFLYLGLNIVQALLATWLLSVATGLNRFSSRVVFVVLVGLLGSLTTNVDYWNWYGFPGTYTAAYILAKTIGFLMVGLVAASLTTVRPRLATRAVLMADQKRELRPLR